MSAQQLIWDIPGGIHPAERKELSNRTPIQPAPLPKRLVLPLNQHIGAAAEPVGGSSSGAAAVAGVAGSAACSAFDVCAWADQQTADSARLRAAARPGLLFKGGDNRRKTIMGIS